MVSFVSESPDFLRQNKKFSSGMNSFFFCFRFQCFVSEDLTRKQFLSCGFTSLLLVALSTDLLQLIQVITHQKLSTKAMKFVRSTLGCFKWVQRLIESKEAKLSLWFWQCLASTHYIICFQRSTKVCFHSFTTFWSKLAGNLTLNSESFPGTNCLSDSLKSSQGMNKEVWFKNWQYIPFWLLECCYKDVRFVLK